MQLLKWWLVTTQKLRTVKYLKKTLDVELLRISSEKMVKILSEQLSIMIQKINNQVPEVLKYQK